MPFRYFDYYPGMHRLLERIDSVERQINSLFKTHASVTYNTSAKTKKSLEELRITLEEHGDRVIWKVEDIQTPYMTELVNFTELEYAHVQEIFTTNVYHIWNTIGNILRYSFNVQNTIGNIPPELADNLAKSFLNLIKLSVSPPSRSLLVIKHQIDSAIAISNVKVLLRTNTRSVKAWEQIPSTATKILRIFRCFKFYSYRFYSKWSSVLLKKKEKFDKEFFNGISLHNYNICGFIYKKLDHILREKCETNKRSDCQHFVELANLILDYSQSREIEGPNENDHSKSKKPKVQYDFLDSGNIKHLEIIEQQIDEIQFRDYDEYLKFVKTIEMPTNMSDEEYLDYINSDFDKWYTFNTSNSQKFFRSMILKHSLVGVATIVSDLIMNEEVAEMIQKFKLEEKGGDFDIKTWQFRETVGYDCLRQLRLPLTSF